MEGDAVVVGLVASYARAPLKSVAFAFSLTVEYRCVPLPASVHRWHNIILFLNRRHHSRYR